MPRNPATVRFLKAQANSLIEWNEIPTLASIAWKLNIYEYRITIDLGTK